MEVFLKTDIDQWFAIRLGYTTPVNEIGETLDPEKWTTEMKKKAQTDSRALNTLQCGLTMEEVNRINPYDNSKELWDRLVKLHEGTNDSKVTKRDLLLNKLFNIKIQSGETATQLHARIKDIINGLHLIGHQLENRDIISNYCRTSLVDFHRSCSKCSYKLCLGCCGKILEGTASQAPAIGSSKASRRERAKKYVISELEGKRKRLFMGEQPDNSLSPIESDTKESHSSSISCPPKESGGCGNGLLKLRYNLPFRWCHAALWKRLHLAAIILTAYTLTPMVHLLSSKTKGSVILVLVC